MGLIQMHQKWSHYHCSHLDSAAVNRAHAPHDCGRPITTFQGILREVCGGNQTNEQKCSETAAAHAHTGALRHGKDGRTIDSQRAGMIEQHVAYERFHMFERADNVGNGKQDIFVPMGRVQSQTFASQKCIMVTRIS